ncbi:MAG: 30S ribosomal protein S3 [Candidatus Pacebacteria bacterium]|jgi:small subunit ribosomal protein S3|nr:30S ribosomal protein S3 [Parcubacteria group bacterium]MDP6249677.1 30S ribosomal protein S3 [Candidatus Paceibacterota bacterium]MDP7159346.1 30S ribosomal protein S3 [Candidatus Paceibacterota bacterium]MDP7368414.1 30S ribosomal protein S3 [Candidatus Paceibacterota bacterium]MDP7466351.1 30S ribosomal protein S3 [Candidatus Paceibacterota bacterium]|tara:strand:- start:6475 stop:7149 length:675 start_codon:yes stop_codon:yes gene_type:complete
MTHTVHPYAHRLGILRDWKSRWFSADPKRYREFIKCDTTVRQYLEKRLRGFYVSSVEIEKGEKTLKIIVKTSRPGMIIGRSGDGATKLKNDIAKVISALHLSDSPEIKLDIEEIRSPESNAAIVSQMVAEALEKRMTFRRVLKQTVEKVMANRDVLGVRIALGGRLGGAEMARKEQIKKGRIPLQTFRADIDFAREKAYLPYGVIGIKVWIYKGDIFPDKKVTK